MITIAASSDFHGNLPEVTEPFDLMLLGGDLEPARNHNWAYQRKWYKEEFLPWVQELPFNNVWSKVIFIGGNHSIFLSQEGHSFRVKELEIDSGGRLVYLHNEWYNFDYLDEDEIKVLTIFGTPYCKIFGNWWNMLNDETLKEKYSEIPSNTDILLSHDCPYGACDMCYGWKDWGRTPMHIGNKVLAEAVLERNITLGIFGHLHTGNHSGELLGDTLCYNVSLLDESYTPIYPIKYIKWPDEVIEKSNYLKQDIQINQIKS